MQKKLAIFSAHDIINDGDFLLIGRLSKWRRQAWLPGIALRPSTMRKAIEAQRFDGKSFPALPLGQGLHGRR
ncbi:hypothetical protein FJ420_23580 [Mesorhizobium sp. B3-1-3]|uniref:hypothetical protein n=1 Tax=unclassified Mesorhizobium TaxID=325217 RepID=UPI00112A38AB|nr:MULTISPECIES: hypothetical protein [unclassified Mesorhizobium]TPI67076.1 hypothetical protein FJ420_23580 [Mesorhizobium sp. B3-1-3]TPI71297.1 hypothetical protein FJ424_00220 [Mesorhizobium sp. B3-1-8]